MPGLNPAHEQDRWGIVGCVENISNGARNLRTLARYFERINSQAFLVNSRLLVLAPICQLKIITFSFVVFRLLLLSVESPDIAAVVDLFYIVEIPQGKRIESFDFRIALERQGKNILHGFQRRVGLGFQ